MCPAPGSSLPMLPVFAAMIAGNFWQLEGAVQYCALHHYRAHDITTHYIHDSDRSLLTNPKSRRAPLRMTVERVSRSVSAECSGGKVLVKFWYQQLPWGLKSSLQLSCRVLQCQCCMILENNLQHLNMYKYLFNFSMKRCKYWYFLKDSYKKTNCMVEMYL